MELLNHLQENKRASRQPLKNDGTRNYVERVRKGLRKLHENLSPICGYLKLILLESAIFLLFVYELYRLILALLQAHP